ncbi:MAG: DUF2460 domain-containing protein [Desulfobacterium sp.]|nr:DUF2460 domain-containing protein [Desulfobacterium sp.]
MADYPATPLPVYTFTAGVEFKTNVFEAENGSEQASSKWASGRRSFTLVYQQQDTDTVWAFFKAKKGRGIAFTFNPHDFLPTKYASELITCRFLEDKAGREFKVLDRFGISFIIREVK